MARFLSPEWVASFDAALSTLDLSDVVAAAGARSLAAADGTFSVAQVVRGAPGPDGVDQELRVVLTVAGGRAHLELDPEGRVAGTATIVLAYPDALAMAQGALVHSAADLAVAVTGIAGPDGGTAEKPVGLVHFASARRGGEPNGLERRFGPLSRGAIRLAAVETALEMLEAAAD